MSEKSFKQDEPEMRRMFVGKLGILQDPEVLVRYFKQWGEVVESTIMTTKDGASRGFGFIMYSSVAEVCFRLGN